MATRAIKIHFSYAVVSFAARLEKATESAPVSTMKNLCVGQPNRTPHPGTPTPITQPKTCAECGPIVDSSVIVKGIDLGGGNYSLTTQEKVAEAKTNATAQFKGKVNLVPHDAADYEADTAPGRNLYYVIPDATGEDSYRLLVEHISEHPEKAFVTMYTPSSVAAPYQVKVRNGVLVMEERVRGQQMRAKPSVGGTANAQFKQMLDMSLDMLTQPYDPDAYEDTYAAAIAKIAAESPDQVSLGQAASTPTPTVVQSDADLGAKLAELAKAAAAKAAA